MPGLLIADDKAIASSRMGRPASRRWRASRRSRASRGSSGDDAEDHPEKQREAVGQHADGQADAGAVDEALSKSRPSVSLPSQNLAPGATGWPWLVSRCRTGQGAVGATSGAPTATTMRMAMITRPATANLSLRKRRQTSVHVPRASTTSARAASRHSLSAASSDSAMPSMLCPPRRRARPRTPAPASGRRLALIPRRTPPWGRRSRAHSASPLIGAHRPGAAEAPTLRRLIFRRPDVRIVLG